MSDKPTTQASAPPSGLRRRPGDDLVPLTEAQEMQLMAYADGELTGDELREAEALIADRRQASVAVHDLGLAKRALQVHLFNEALSISADLTRVRGAVMTGLPAPVRATIATETTWAARLSAWSRSFFQPGRMGLLAGGAMAAMLLVVMLRPDTAPEAPELRSQTAQTGHEGHVDHATETALVKPDEGEQPGVIIEDMELDGGTVLFEGAEKPGETMIIWHLQPDEGGAG